MKHRDASTAKRHARNGTEVLDNLPRYLYGVFILLVLFLVVFVAPIISYAYKKSTAVVIPADLVLAVLVCLGLCAAAEIVPPRLRDKLERPRTFATVAAIGTLVLLALQLLIVQAAWFKSGWDIGNMTSPASNTDTVYFSHFHNNLLLAGIFSHLSPLGGALGIDSYLVFVFGSCVCVSLSVMLMAFTARKTAGYKVGYATFLVCLLFIGLSPWFLIPYSDTYAMPFTSLVLWAYCCLEKKPMKWGTISFAVLFGFFIKPTVALVGFAIAIVELVRGIESLRNRSHGDSTAPQSAPAPPVAQLDAPSPSRAARPGALSLAVRPDEPPHHTLRSAVSVIAAIAVGLSLALILDRALMLQVIDFDPEQEMTYAHMLQLGMNPDTDGTYSEADMSFSASFQTKEERNRADLQRAFQRIHDLGPVGMAQLLGKKVCVAYADGSFAWGCEVVFWLEVPHDGRNFFMDLYGVSEGSETFAASPFEGPFQVIWLGTMIGVALSCFRKVRQVTDARSMMYLTLFLLGLFLLASEVRARYLFLYAPYFVMLGSMGWARCGHRLKRIRLERRRPHAGGGLLAHADGEDSDGGEAARRDGAAVHFGHHDHRHARCLPRHRGGGPGTGRDGPQYRPRCTGRLEGGTGPQDLEAHARKLTSGRILRRQQ